jgi:hypothetical protein
MSVRQPPGQTGGAVATSAESERGLLTSPLLLRLQQLTELLLGPFGVYYLYDSVRGVPQLGERQLLSPLDQVGLRHSHPARIDL